MEPIESNSARRSSSVFISLGAGLAAAGVLCGAFGAHALRRLLDADKLAVFHTGASYHLIHALGLMVVGIVLRVHPAPTKWMVASGLFILAGIVLFSGSLYVFALSDVKYVTVLTPIGGIGFVIGWLLLAITSKKW